MTDTESLIETLFATYMIDPNPVALDLDFSSVVPLKVSQTVDILPGMHADRSIAERFNVTVRTVRERGRARNLGRTLSDTRWFTEAEILALMTEGSGRCSNSRNGGTPPTSMRGERFSKSPLIKALELATEKKPKSSSLRSKTKSSSGKRMVPFSPRKHSQAPR
jgi:hypothetical protein